MLTSQGGTWQNIFKSQHVGRTRRIRYLMRIGCLMKAGYGVVGDAALLLDDLIPTRKVIQPVVLPWENYGPDFFPTGARCGEFRSARRWPCCIQTKVLGRECLSSSALILWWSWRESLSFPFILQSVSKSENFGSMIPEDRWWLDRTPYVITINRSNLK